MNVFLIKYNKRCSMYNNAPTANLSEVLEIVGDGFKIDVLELANNLSRSVLDSFLTAREEGNKTKRMIKNAVMSKRYMVEFMTNNTGIPIVIIKDFGRTEVLILSDDGSDLRNTIRDL